LDEIVVILVFGTLESLQGHLAHHLRPRHLHKNNKKSKIRLKFTE
jgi:hypothetical protein